jgi:glutamate-1-semialdehyde aminotransferase
VLKFTFELLHHESICSLSLGHMTVVGHYGKTTSKGESSRAAMMIFITMTDLLNGIRQLILDESIKSYNFVGVDSSFQFYVKRENSNLVIKDSFNRKIDEVSSLQLVHSVWEGVQEFLSKYGHYIGSEEMVYEDIKYSTEEFKKVFSELLNNTKLSG